MLFKVVKQGFNTRRKTLRNSLRSMFTPEALQAEIFNLRPETLSVEQFVDLANLASKQQLD
jgi:16S rRNA (adenine1518-N6/adenine1519-N6)-dimethyltransferase